MPQLPEQNQQKKECEEVKQIIARCSRLTDWFDNSAEWIEVCEDYKITAQSLDNVWAFETDEKKLYKLQVNKMGVMAILQMPETYRQERNRALEQLKVLENPKTVIQKDFDNE